MIQMQTELDVADNSGAKSVMCIKVLGGSHRRYADVGDIIVVSVQEALPRGRVKKGEVLKASDAVRTQMSARRLVQGESSSSQPSPSKRRTKVGVPKVPATHTSFLAEPVTLPSAGSTSLTVHSPPTRCRTTVAFSIEE